MDRALLSQIGRDPPCLAAALPVAPRTGAVVRPGTPRHRHVLERCRLRGRKTVLAGLNGSQAGAASITGTPAIFFELRRERPMTTHASRRSQAIFRRAAHAEWRGGDRALRRAARCRGAAELFPLADDALPLQPLPRRHAANCRRRCSSDFIHVGEADQFSVVATMLVDGFETIVGEARYAFDMPRPPASNSACRSTTAGRATASARRC